MKKTMRWIALALVAVMLCMMLVSCAKTLSGTYTAGGSVLGTGGDVSYTFSGKKVTVTVTSSVFGMSSSTEFEGRYEIAEAANGDMTIIFTFEDDDARSYEGEFTFEETEKGIKIGLIEYTKK